LPVPSTVLTAIACTPIVAGWLGVCVSRYLPGRRRVHARQWTRIAAGLSELDAELDRAWAEEQERIRRYQ
jgi:hypothetical protein